jgi:prepilin-type N-terminal cleavage/methylation domain-containing protein
MRQDTGFSFLEVMVVMAIMAILSAIAIPGIIQWLPKHRVGVAARDVKSTLEFARSNAIKRNTEVRVDFDWANDSLTVVEVLEINPGTFVETILRIRQMPGDVDLQDIDLGTPVKFSGHGISSESGRVRVENSTNATLGRSITLTIGGNSRIQ